MQKLNTYLLLLIFSLTSVSLTSCLKDDDEDIVRYSDCSISAFSLGTLNKYTKTISSKTGNDTIVKTTFAGSAYRFTIDQMKHEIYNVDSLPMGTDTLHVICNITALNGGYVTIKSAQSDSIFYYNSTDSISFEKNPRTFVITSNDVSCSTTYTVKLNVHKEDSKQMTWNAPYKVDVFADADCIQSTEWNGNMLVKTVKNGNITLYASPLGDGKNWTAITPDTNLSTTANISSFGTMLYTSDEYGCICKSTDGAHWENVTELSDVHHRVLGLSNGKLYIKTMGQDADGYPTAFINAYDINAGKMLYEPIYDDSYSLLELENTSLCEVKKKNMVVGTTITGVTNAGAAVLYKAENTAESQKWMFLTNESGQNLPNNCSKVVPYGEFLLALANGKFYTSLDFGRSWQERYYVYPPSSLSTEGSSHLFADSRGILWIIDTNGQVYTGKLNYVAWER